MAKKQISIGFDEKQLEWLRDRFATTGCNISETVRRLVDTAMIKSVRDKLTDIPAGLPDVPETPTL